MRRSDHTVGCWLASVAVTLLAAGGVPAAWGAPAPPPRLAEAAASDDPVTEAGLEEEFRRAREGLRASPDYQEGEAASHFRFAETLAHRGDLTGATEEYQAAIRLRPDFAEAYRGLGVVFLDRHDWPGAADALQAAVRLQHDDAQALYWLGRARMALHDWPGAVAALRRAVELKPDDAEAYADLGLVHMVQGEPADAARALRHAIQLKPDNADAHHLLETVQMHQDDPEHVEEAARRILETLFERE